MSTPPSNSVAEHRRDRGWSQEELARRAGVSRAEVSAVETGRVVPSVVGALSLARALGCGVEELFGVSSPRREGPVWVGSPATGGRFWEARVGRRLVRYPVEPTAVGTVPHDGVEGAAGRAPSRRRTLPDTIVLAGCDPAVGLLAAELARATGLRLLPLTRSSRRSLELMGRGVVHLAGVHLCDAAGRADNARAVRQALGPGYRLVHLARWQEGVALAPGLQLASPGEVVRARVRWVGREEGSGARACLDRLLGAGRTSPSRLRHVALDHRATAEAIRSGWAEAGVCVRLAAEEARLGFLPFQQEAYEFCFPEALEGERPLADLLRVVGSRRFRGLVAELPGYDARKTGEVRPA